MLRHASLSLLIASFAILIASSWCHAQANRPLEVPAPAEPTPRQSAQPVDNQSLYEKARQIATKADRPAAPPAELDQPAFDPPASQSRPAVGTTGDAPLAPAPATADRRATPAPPVVPVSPNESKPLGPASPGPGQDGKIPDASANQGWGVMKTLLALGFVVVLILAARQVMLRWMGRPAAVNRSRVVETLLRVSVGPRQHVVLLRIGPRILVVGDSAGQMRQLANIDEPEEVAAILKSVSESKPTGISQSFGQMLGRFDQEYDEEDTTRLRFEGRDVNEVQTDRARDQLSGLLSRVRSMASGGGAAATGTTTRAQKTDRGTA